MSEKELYGDYLGKEAFISKYNDPSLNKLIKESEYKCCEYFYIVEEAERFVKKYGGELIEATEPEDVNVFERIAGILRNKRKTRKIWWVLYNPMPIVNKKKNKTDDNIDLEDEDGF